MDRHAPPGGHPRPYRRLLATCAALALAAACGPAQETETAGDAGGTSPVATPASPSPEVEPSPRVTATTPAPATPGGGSPSRAAGDGAAGASPSESPAGTSGGVSWPVVAPEDAGFAPDLEERVEEAAARYPGIQAVLVARGGRLAAEFRRGGASHHNVYSVTKSVVGTLAGIAIGDGALTLDTRVEDVLGDRLPARAGAQVGALTVEDLLAMTAGLPDDLSLPPPPRDGDWVAHALAQPLGPLGRFTYSSTTSHVLGAMVAEATGTDLLTYARERLFDPLGIDTSGAHTPALTSVLPGLLAQGPYAEAAFAWPTDPRGLHLGYCCLKLTPRDLLALGQLWLQGGVWEGRQLVPAGFVEAATAADGDGYGYHWWVGGAGRHHAFHAAGLGGQVVEVVPDLELVVVIVSADLTGTGSRALVREVVLPALR